MAHTHSLPGGKVGLALAGGGPEGAVYEIGVLRALDEYLVGIDLNALDVYVGVSAGSFIGANLANRISPIEMCRTIIEPGGYAYDAGTFFTPLVGEYVKRGLMVPRLLFEAIWEHAVRPHSPSLAESLSRFSTVLPIAIYDNEPIRRYLEDLYHQEGRSDDFRELASKLIIVAADLDSGLPVLFGAGDFQHVPISRAIQASAALPGIYPPVSIEGHHYVDGVLLKTLHASVALDAGADLVFCINPIVPLDISARNGHGPKSHRPGNGYAATYDNLMDHGLPSVLGQTFRTIVHSRLTVGMAAYTPRYPDADVVLFEPPRDDETMFFVNVFSFADRRLVCEHAYNATRRDLLMRYEELAPLLERHGITIDRAALSDPSRGLWSGMGVSHPFAGEPVTATLDRLLSRLETVIAREA